MCAHERACTCAMEVGQGRSRPCVHKSMALLQEHPNSGTTLWSVLLTWFFHPGSWKPECKNGLNLYTVQLPYFQKS